MIGMMRVLVIDDDAGIRALLEIILKQSGYDVVLAANGEDGLRQCRSQKVDLVITDLFMPKKEGLETIRAIHKDWPQLGIIAISGKPGAFTMLDVVNLAPARLDSR